MDMAAHALWVAAGVTWASRRWPISTPVAAAAVGMAVLPDLLQGVPVLIWALFSGTDLAVIADFAVAGPGAQSALPSLVDAWSHHLHCILHSAPIALVVSAATWALRPALWPILAAWWSHIVIDVLTHSNEFYPVPVLYPFTMVGFDGIPWNTPWFVVLNYTALAMAWLALGLSRRR
jgi:hypothetical protein